MYLLVLTEAKMLMPAVEKCCMWKHISNVSGRSVAHLSQGQIVGCGQARPKRLEDADELEVFQKKEIGMIKGL